MNVAAGTMIRRNIDYVESAELLVDDMMQDWNTAAMSSVETQQEIEHVTCAVVMQISEDTGEEVVQKRSSEAPQQWTPVIKVSALTWTPSLNTISDLYRYQW